MTRVLAQVDFGFRRGTIKRLSLLVSAACILSACTGNEQKPKPVFPSQSKRLAGRIDRVVEESRFVLIRTYGKWSVIEGETVQSVGEGRSANLLPTGEELGEHVAADIRSGSVKVGDAVYIRKSHTN